MEKLTTEDWPGPVLASLNMSAKGYGQSRDQGVGQNLSVGQNRGQKMIIAGQDCKDRIQSVVWTSFQHPVQGAALSRRAAKLPVPAALMRTCPQHGGACIASIHN